MPDFIDEVAVLAKELNVLAPEFLTKHVSSSVKTVLRLWLLRPHVINNALGPHDLKDQ